MEASILKNELMKMNETQSAVCELNKNFEDLKKEIQSKFEHWEIMNPT